MFLTKSLFSYVFKLIKFYCIYFCIKKIVAQVEKIQCVVVYTIPMFGAGYILRASHLGFVFLYFCYSIYTSILTPKLEVNLKIIFFFSVWCVFLVCNI